MKPGQLLPSEFYDSLDDTVEQAFEWQAEGRRQQTRSVRMTEFCAFHALCMSEAERQHARLKGTLLTGKNADALRAVARGVESFTEEALDKVLEIPTPATFESVFDLVALFKTKVARLIEQDFRRLVGAQNHSVLRDEDGNVLYHAERINVHDRQLCAAPADADLSPRPMTRIVHHVSQFIERQPRDPDTGELDGDGEVIRVGTETETTTWVFESPAMAALGINVVISAMRRQKLTAPRRLLLRIFELARDRPELDLVSKTDMGWSFDNRLIADELNKVTADELGVGVADIPDHLLVKVTDVGNATRPITANKNQLAPALGWSTLEDLAKDVAAVIAPARHPLAQK